MQGTYGGGAEWLNVYSVARPRTATVAAGETEPRDIQAIL